MKNGYTSIWKNSLSELLDRINELNNTPATPGVTYDLQQVIPIQSKHPHDTQYTEEWVGIVYVHTPPQSVSDPDYLE